MISRMLFLLLFHLGGVGLANDTGTPIPVDDSGLNTPTDASSTDAQDKGTSTRRERAERSLPPPPRFSEQYQRELIALSGLFILWLITRISSQPKQSKRQNRRPSRPTPVNSEELARSVFSIGRSQEFDTYRALYLTGSEAGRLFGETKAKAYLNRRNVDTLKEVFQRLVDDLGQGARYSGARVVQDNVLVLICTDMTNTEFHLPIGEVTHVGAILRLIVPADRVSTDAVDIPAVEHRPPVAQGLSDTMPLNGEDVDDLDTE